MDLREEMVLRALDHRFTVTEVAERFNVSRRTVQVWRDRYRENGRAGLEDRSHAPHSCPHRTSKELEDLIVAEYEACRYGAKKVRQRLLDRDPHRALPSQATFDAIFVRRGLSEPKPRRPKPLSPAAARFTANEPGELFTMDYKGQFRLGTGAYCYPLTIMDRVSSFLLCCEAHRAITAAGTWDAIERVLREVGCPLAMQSDNGTPFGVPGGGFSSISVRLMKLGIQPVFNRPGRPQDNSCHERMHRELKKEAARPPAKDFPQEQSVLDTFKHGYNYERPHQGLGMRRPAEFFRGGVRPYPTRVRKPEYCSSWEPRKVNSVGQIKWLSHDIYVGSAFAGETIALEPVAEALCVIYFYAFTLGKLDEQTMKII